MPKARVVLCESEVYPDYGMYLAEDDDKQNVTLIDQEILDRYEAVKKEYNAMQEVIRDELGRLQKEYGQKRHAFILELKSLLRRYDVDIHEGSEYTKPSFNHAGFSIDLHEVSIYE